MITIIISSLLFFLKINNKLTFDSVFEALRKEGWKLELSENTGEKHAKTLYDTRTIIIDKLLSEQEMLHLLLHEAGHIKLNHFSGIMAAKDKMRLDNETETFAMCVKGYAKIKTFFYYFLVLALLFAAVFYFRLYNKSKEPEPVSVNQNISKNIQVSTAAPQENITTYVYVTPHGKKYHRADCRYVQNKDDIKQMTIKAAQNKYEPCSVCKPE